MTPTPLKQPHRFRPGIHTKAFNENKLEHYTWMLEHAPVCRSKLFVLPVVTVATYDGCKQLLSSPLFVRNRKTATGGRAFPVPIPKSLEMMLKGLITQDDPEHKRQRRLVAKAFTPKTLGTLQAAIDDVVEEHLDRLRGPVDLLEAYCLPIPSIIIATMLGIEEAEVAQFQRGLSALSTGMNGLSALRTFVYDMPKLIELTRGVIHRKTQQPGDDLLTAMIQAQEDGDRLTEDELVAMTFTLIMAGYETTVHLIGNAVVTLLRHPDQLAQLLEDPELWGGAVEEVLRVLGPVQATKQMYATEDTEIEGYAIPKGTLVIPLLGAANLDPTRFDAPLSFDIHRAPNKHVGFGHGIHHCLGAALARMETISALRGFFERFPDLQLARPASELELVNMPLWHRYKHIPVDLGSRV